MEEAQLWNKEAADKFTKYMEDEIKLLLGESDFEASIDNLCHERIGDCAQQKLKAIKKANYKYVTDVMIMPRGSGYKKDTKFFWQPKSDKAIRVTVSTDYLHCSLVAYCLHV